MKKILFSLILFSTVSMPVFAGENEDSKESRDRYYIPSRLVDNTFVSVSGGLQGQFSPDAVKNFPNCNLPGFNVAPGPRVGFAVGKWMSAVWGGRIGFEFGNGGAVMPAGMPLETGVASPLFGYVQKGDKLHEKSGFMNLHMDLLCNWQNVVRRNPERLYSFIPYLTVGWTLNMATESDKIMRAPNLSLMDTFTGGIGAINNFKVADRMNVFLDLRFMLMHPRNYSDVSALRSVMPSMELGFSYDIGHVGWVPVTRDGYVAKDSNDGKSHGFIADYHFIDHTFVMANGGVNHAFGRYKANSVGYGVEAGRWFSPYFGGRIGYWGGDAGKILKQRYFHMDLLFDVLGMSGVRSQRVYTIAPYLHCGIGCNGGEDNSNPVKVGGGILQSFRIYKGLDAIIDASYVANSRYERVGTIQAGLAYNFGERDWESTQVTPEAEEQKEKKWAVYTNILGYVDGTLNIGAQYAVARHWTLDGQLIVNPHLYGFKNTINEKNMVSLGARLWPWFVYSGFWCRFSAFAQDYHSYMAYGLFKNDKADRVFSVAEAPSIAERGDAYGVGISLGYSWIITETFNLELGLGGIGGYKNFVQYQNASFDTPLDHNHHGKGFACLNDFSLSAVFVF